MFYTRREPAKRARASNDDVSVDVSRKIEVIISAQVIPVNSERTLLGTIDTIKLVAIGINIGVAEFSGCTYTLPMGTI